MRSQLALASLTLAGLAFLATPSAQAQSLTYMLSGTGTGSLFRPGSPASPFNNQTFTFTETAPISGVTTSGFNQFNFASTVNFVLGSNSGTLANGGAVVGNVGGSTANAGFATPGGDGLLGSTLTAGPLTLTTPQSPVALNPGIDNIFTASFGLVLFTSITNLTFSSTPAAVPEPGSLALLTGMTLTGAAFLRRRKQVSKAA